MADIPTLIAEADRHFQAQRFAESDRLYAEILTADRDNIQALFQRSRLSVTLGRLADAKAMLGRVLDLRADHVAALQGMAWVAQRTGDLATAADCYARVERLEPSDPAAAYNSAVVQQMLGRLAEAEASLRRAIAIDQAFAPACNNLGNLLMQQGRHAEAEACYRQALAGQPPIASVHYNLGLALQKLGRFDEARSVLTEALVRMPNDAGAMFALGTLHQDARSLEEAVNWYRRAIAVEPGLVDAHFNLATALRDLQRHEEAIAAFQAVLRVASNASSPVPENIMAGSYFGIADLYKSQNRLDEWIAHFDSAPSALRDDVRRTQYGFEIGMRLGDFTRANRELATLVRDVERIAEIGPLPRLLGMLQYVDLPQQALLSFYRRFNALAEAHTGGQRVTPTSRPREGRRIRIGYLSPDFKVHIMGLLMFEVLSRHDRDRFEVFLYALNDSEDELSAKFRTICDRYAVVDAPTALENARRIADDELDLLIDLGGHMAGSRPLILAYKPAPVQITHLGYHGALGLETVDYKVTDAFADLPGNARYLVEDLLPMRGCLMPFLRRKPSPGGRSRADLGIADDAIVFGVFVNALKLSPRCLSAWRAILDRVEHGVLAFSPHYTWARDATLRCMEAAGFPRSRIVFISTGDERDFGRWRYRLVDVVLDTFPYTGGDTTVAALDMGVPVVTQCGERQSERVTFSILSNLGVEGTIAASDAEYVDIACRLAEDPGLRARTSAQILDRLDKSDISDMATYTRNLEGAFLEAIAARRAAVS